MFKNAIIPSGSFPGSVCTYFRDLNIIMPLRCATLHIENGKNYEVFVGKDRLSSPVCSNDNYDSYDLTEFVAECDFLFIKASEKENLALRARIDLEFAGGINKTIFTDESWYWSNSGTPDKGSEVFEIFKNNVSVIE